MKTRKCLKRFLLRVGKVRSGQRYEYLTKKPPFWAFKTQNFEKVYKIKGKIWTILHTIFKAQILWLLVVGGAMLLLKECINIKLPPGIVCCILH